MKSFRGRSVSWIECTRRRPYTLKVCKQTNKLRNQKANKQINKETTTTTNPQTKTNGKNVKLRKSVRLPKVKITHRKDNIHDKLHRQLRYTH